MNPVPPAMYLSPEELPNVTHLVTEDDTPVDNFFSGAQQRLLVRSRDSWTKEVSFVAAADIGLFYSDEEPPLVPDFLLSINVKMPADWWAKKNRSYFIWRFGKAPDVVVEIVSNKEGSEDGDKMKMYAQIGVPYYVIFDPQRLLSEDVLSVYCLNGRAYVGCEPWLETVGLSLQLWEGTFEGREDTWLRWFDHQDKVIPTGAERAEEEKQRAEQEKQRAEQEKQRADRLAAQLRTLGIEPDA